MALTDIAKQLKKAFPRSYHEVTGLGEVCKRFRAIYHDVETIRFDGTDYIVINGEYRNDSSDEEVYENESPIFYQSIKNSYAIIDEKNAYTLINEVHSRITYMQWKRKDANAPTKEEVRASVKPLMGNFQLDTDDVDIPEEDSFSGDANIFRCYLRKETGVSATTDTYNFMIKNDEVKEFGESETILSKMDLRGAEFLRDSEIVDKYSTAIQNAVYEHFDRESGNEIQSISVKSIFQIALAFRNVKVLFQDVDPKTQEKNWAVYDTAHFHSGDSRFDAALNANAHTCNCCGRDLVATNHGNGESKRFALHLNIDAVYPSEIPEDFKDKLSKFKKENGEEVVPYAVGCENCLERCPDCGKWHFKYGKFLGTNQYDKIKFAHGRGFIRGLRSIEANYCSCREGIEWVHDEKSGNEKDGEYDIIPVTKIAFVNYADEKLAGFEECRAFYKKINNLTDDTIGKGFDEAIKRFKDKLAARFRIDVGDIKITSVDKCKRCSVCGGEYFTYGGSPASLASYRCSVCDTMSRDKKKMVTRADGVIFMRHRKKLNKYLMNPLGNLTLLSSQTIDLGEDEAETAKKGKRRAK